MPETNETFDTIDLRELFGVLMRRIWSIILATLLFGAAAFGYTYFFVDPLYQASALLYVNNSDVSVGSASFSISTSDLTAAQKLVNTYIVILRSRTVLNEVIEAAGLDCTYGQLSSMITAESVNSTEVFRIVVTSKSPTEAELIANTIADLLPERIPAIVNGSDVRIVDYAVVPSARSSPSFTRNTVVGALIGLVLSVAVVVLSHLFDENIRSEDYLAMAYPNIPLLAVIPDMRSSKQHSYGYRYGGGYRYGYGYGSARRSVRAADEGGSARSAKPRAAAKGTEENDG